MIFIRTRAGLVNPTHIARIHTQKRDGNRVCVLRDADGNKIAETWKDERDLYDLSCPVIPAASG